MVVGKYHIILKPLMVLIIASGIAGMIAVATIKNVIPSKAAATPDFGYVNPTRWKFQARAGAQATIESITGDKTAQTISNKQGDFLNDIRQGVTAKITEPGKSADYVYLRNGFNLTQATEGRDLTLEFEASAPEAHPVVFALRDHANLLWHQQFDVNGDWKKFKTTIPMADLKRGKNNNLILAVHLAFKPGDISLRNILIK